jgi:nucleolar complex protein 2
MGETAQILAFQAIRALLLWFMQQQGEKKDASLFEFTVKKIYNDFTLESKTGGGGFQVQDRIRVSQNCFVDLLSLDLPTAYQMGFLYIRQLCLHLRGIRNNLTKDGVKNIYSWQFYNCIRLWVLAVTQHQSELSLLIHPLVQLGIGAVRLSNNPKYFPFHVKIVQLLTLINEKTKQFVPIA